MISHFKLNIILWYTGLLVVILAAVFILLYGILDYQLTQDVNNDLRQKIEWISSLKSEDDTVETGSKKPRKETFNKEYLDDIIERTTDLDKKYILFIYQGDSLTYSSPNHTQLITSLRPFVISGGLSVTMKLQNTPFKIASIQKTDYMVYLGYELTALYSLQKRILNLFLFIFPFGIVLSILCGYLVTRRSLNVIKTITETAARITSKNLNERITVPTGKDEIIILINTLNSMIDRLEKSFLTVQQFSHDAAHELKTPLTIIRGELEMLLKEDKCSDELVKTIENIIEEIQYLSSIANKLLLIHSLDTGKVEHHFIAVKLDKIIEETFQDAKILSAEKNLSLRLEKNDPVEVTGDEELLIRLLWNIIDNAVKFTPFGGNISLSLEKRGGNAVITVTDTGVGIPQEDIPKIFNRFYRVDKSHSRQLGGSGLGLAICKWIVELHKGEITVKSEVNKGSQFAVILPLSSHGDL